MACFPETLETQRLLLRPRRVEEAALFRGLWAERDERVPARRRIDAEGRPTVADVAALLAEDHGVWAVERRDTGEVLGYCGLVLDDDAPDAPEIVFELFATAHGQGFATEAAGAVTAWVRATGAFPRLTATVWDWNTASRRVLAKLGFDEVGVDRTGPHGDSLLAVLEP